MEKILKERYSVREFSNKRVEKSTVEEILEIARLAPTALNNQPYFIYVAQSDESLEKIRNSLAPDYNATTVLIVCSDKNNGWKNRYSGQDNVLQDIGIIASTILYVSKSKGVDSCYVCNFNPEILKEQLCLPDSVYPECLIYLGYPSKDCKPSDRHYKRREIKEFVKFL
jgi:nitroreductase